MDENKNLKKKLSPPPPPRHLNSLEYVENYSNFIEALSIY